MVRLSRGAVGDLGRAEYYGPGTSDHVAAALFEWRPAYIPTYAYTVRLLPATGVFGILGCMGPNSQQFADLYDKLKSLAERQLRSNANLPIGADTLLHEAYLQMSVRDAVFPDQDRFIGYASRVMRGLIIDLVREKRALKHGSGFHITQLPTELGLSQDPEVMAEPLARLSEALDQLATRDQRLAEVVDLKYFCGYTFEDIAALRGTSKRTVLRDWEKARLLLYRQLKDLPDFSADPVE